MLLELKRAVEVAQRRLDNNETLSDWTSLNIQKVVRLLSFYLNATYLSFRAEFYQQMFGMDLFFEWRPNGSISMSVFQKSTHMDRNLDFDSHYPLTHKTAVVRTLQ